MFFKQHGVVTAGSEILRNVVHFIFKQCQVVSQMKLGDLDFLELADLDLALDYSN